MTSLLEEEGTASGFPPAFPRQSESQIFVVEHSCIGIHGVAADHVFEVEL
jgi:hypothetical protein